MTVTIPYVESEAISDGTTSSNFAALKTDLGNSETLVSSGIEYAYKEFDMGDTYEGNWFRITATWTTVDNGVLQLGLSSYGAAGQTLAAIDAQGDFKLKGSLTSSNEVTLSVPFRSSIHRYCYIAFNEAVGTCTDISIQCDIGKFGPNTDAGHALTLHPFAGLNLPYLVLFPKNYDNAKTYPLVLNFGGSGSPGNTGDILMIDGLVTFSKYMWDTWYHTEEYDAITVIIQTPTTLNMFGVDAPYYPTGTQGSYHKPFDGDLSKGKSAYGWTTEAVMDLVDTLIADSSYYINEDKIYTIGFSAGGIFQWSLAQRGREIFSSVVDVAGYILGPHVTTQTSGDKYFEEKAEQRIRLLPRIAERLQHLHIWRSHDERWDDLPIVWRSGFDHSDYSDYPPEIEDSFFPLYRKDGATFSTQKLGAHDSLPASVFGDASFITDLFASSRIEADADPYPGGAYFQLGDQDFHKYLPPTSNTLADACDITAITASIDITSSGTYLMPANTGFAASIITSFNGVPFDLTMDTHSRLFFTGNNAPEGDLLLKNDGDKGYFYNSNMDDVIEIVLSAKEGIYAMNITINPQGIVL